MRVLLITLIVLMNVACGPDESEKLDRLYSECTTNFGDKTCSCIQDNYGIPEGSDIKGDNNPLINEYFGEFASCFKDIKELQ